MGRSTRSSSSSWSGRTGTDVRWRSSCSTWTASRRSTTSTATRRGTAPPGGARFSTPPTASCTIRSAGDPAACSGCRSDARGRYPLGKGLVSALDDLLVKFGMISNEVPTTEELAWLKESRERVGLVIRARWAILAILAGYAAYSFFFFRHSTAGGL